MMKQFDNIVLSLNLDYLFLFLVFIWSLRKSKSLREYENSHCEAWSYKKKKYKEIKAYKKSV